MKPFNFVQQDPGLFRPLEPNEGFDLSPNSVWLKCRFPAELPTGRYYLTVGIFDEIRLYRPNGGGQYREQHTGRLVAPADRELAGVPYALVLQHTAGENQDLFLQIRNDLPLGQPTIEPRLYGERSFLLTADEIQPEQGRNQFILGLLGGTLFAFSLFPLALFVFNRQKYFLYYAGYILMSFLFFCFTFERFSHLHLFFVDFPELMKHIETPLNSTTIILYFLFLRSFLDAKHRAPFLHKFLGFLIVYQLTFQLLDLFIFKLLMNDHTVAYAYAKVGTIPGFLCCFYLLFVVFRWKKLESNFIGIGMVCFLLGVICSIWRMEGSFDAPPYSIFDNHHLFFHFGIVLEMFFFSIALSHRNQSIFRARIEAQNNLKAMQELDKAKDHLYANITHEFRTPLQVIQGVAGQIRKEPRINLEKRLNLIEKNGQHLLSLVNQMLDLAKLEAGSLQLRPLRSDVISYLRYLVDCSRSAGAHKQIEISFQTPVAQLEMDYDPERLQQVVFNLFSNAIKFTPEGGKVSLELQHHGRGKAADAPEQLILIFRDTGIGIPGHRLPRIFDRYYSGSLASEGKTTGSTGIGLALVRELLSLMGGEISVDSEKGKGAEFRLRLPISRLAEKAQPVAGDDTGRQAINLSLPANGQLPIVSTKADKRPLLLLVEDHEDVLYYLHSQLGERYQIVEAMDGEAALSKAVRLVPDIILSDVMMPRSDGFELCRNLKQDARTRHIPIVLLTAKVGDKDKYTALELGVEAFLSKPVKDKELLLQLENILQKRRDLQKHYQNYLRGASAIDLSETRENTFLNLLHQTVMAHLEDPSFGPKQLCRELRVSKTQLYRILHTTTGFTVARYIRSIRLNAAKKLLETTDRSIGEIAASVGFKSQSYFSRTFVQEFGILPKGLR